MSKTMSAVLLVASPLILSGCGGEGPIVETADALPPVVETQPGVGHIYGRWATDPAFCSADGVSRTIDIGEGHLRAANHTCTMTTPERNGGGWLVTLECSGDSGDPVTERVRFVPSEDRLELNYIDRAQRNDERLVRCPT